MKFLHIPKFNVPANIDEIISQQQVRPLDICLDCKHVKCSCGSCHSYLCSEPCGYESDGGVEVQQ